MASEDTEITLGAGRLLGLFFLLAALCGVFFSIGYSLGKSTAREQALNDQPTEVLAASPPATATSGAGEGKPSAAVAAKSDAAPPAQDQAAASNVQNNLTFYKAVQQNGVNVQPAANDSTPTATQKASPEVAAANAATQASETAGRGSASPVSHSAPVTGP